MRWRIVGKMLIFKKFPPRTQVASVYSVIMLMVYGWTIYSFFWEVPSWLHYLNLGEIIALLAYSVVTNFIESVAILGIPITLALVLPKSWFLDRFVAQGSVMCAAGLGFAMYVASLLSYEEAFPIKLILKTTPRAIAGILVLTILSGGIKFLRGLIEKLADRLIIFLYVSLPISAVSLVVVIFRNLVRSY